MKAVVSAAAAAGCPVAVVGSSHNREMVRRRFEHCGNCWGVIEPCGAQAGTDMQSWGRRAEAEVKRSTTPSEDGKY